MFLQGFLVLTCIFASCMALGGLWMLARRFSAMELRRRYEMECVIKSMQALEQQNLMLQDRLTSITAPREAAAKFETLSSNTQANATEEELQNQLPASPSRLLH